MSEPLPLPATLVRRIQEFIEGHKHGQIVINFNSGKIESHEVREFIRTPTARGPAETLVRDPRPVKPAEETT